MSSIYSSTFWSSQDGSNSNSSSSSSGSRNGRGGGGGAPSSIVAGGSSSFDSDLHDLQRRRGSWSSDLVLCEGSSSEADFDFVRSSANVNYASSNDGSDIFDGLLNTSSSVGVGSGQYSNVTTRRQQQHKQQQHKQQPNVVSFDDEDEEDVIAEDDDFDFSHLLPDSEEDEEDDSESDDNFVFEPYYDRQTNRTIMRLRMKNAFLLNRETSILEEEDDDLDDGGYEEVLDGGDQELPPPYPLPQRQQQQQQRQQQVVPEPVTTRRNQQDETYHRLQHHHHHHHHHHSNHRDDNDETPLTWKKLRHIESSSSSSPPPPHVDAHASQGRATVTDEDQALPQLCPSSVTSGSEETNPGETERNNVVDTTSTKSNTKTTNLEPWKAVHLIPPPPPPPPRTQEEEEDVQTIQEVEPEKPKMESQTKPQSHILHQPPHIERSYDDPPTPARPKHQPQTALPTSSNEPQVPVQNQLALYADMIQSRQPIDAVKQMMQRDSNLSEREVNAFVMGVQSMARLLEEATAAAAKATAAPKVTEEVVVESKSTPSPETTTSKTTTQQQTKKPQRPLGSFSFDSDDDQKRMSRLMMDFLKDSTKSKNKARRPDESKSAVSVMSTLSCRELSIQRLQRRLAAKRKTDDDQVEGLLKELQEAQNRQKRLEQQLNKAGISLADDIPYEEAKAMVEKIAQKMHSIGTSKAVHADPQRQKKLRQEYFVLEQQMEKYMRALELTDEYLQEQLALERNWDEAQRAANRAALTLVWSHMPVTFRKASVSEWLDTPTPNGKYVPKPFLQKFSRTNVLGLLRMNPEHVKRSHPSNLESRRISGLTLTERRALEAYLQPIATTYWKSNGSASGNPLTKRKWNWYCVLRQSLKDQVASLERHVEKYGKANKDCNKKCGCNHFGSSKCPAFENLDYTLEDYGYPCDPEQAIYEDVEDGKRSRSSSPPKGSSPTKTKSTTPQRPSPRKVASSTSLLAEIAAARGKDTIKRKVLLKKTTPRRSSTMDVGSGNNNANNNNSLRSSFMAELQGKAAAQNAKKKAAAAIVP